MKSYYSTLRHNRVHLNTFQYVKRIKVIKQITVNYNTLRHITPQYITVYYNTLQ